MEPNSSSEHSGLLQLGVYLSLLPLAHWALGVRRAGAAEFIGKVRGQGET